MMYSGYTKCIDDYASGLVDNLQNDSRAFLQNNLVCHLQWCLPAGHCIVKYLLVNCAYLTIALIVCFLVVHWHS